MTILKASLCLVLSTLAVSFAQAGGYFNHGGSGLVSAGASQSTSTSSVTVFSSSSSSTSGGQIEIGNLEAIKDGDTFSLDTLGKKEWVLSGVDGSHVGTARRINIVGESEELIPSTMSSVKFSYESGARFRGNQTREAEYYSELSAARVRVPRGAGVITLWVATGDADNAVASVSLNGRDATTTFVDRRKITVHYSTASDSVLTIELANGDNAHAAILAVALKLGQDERRTFKGFFSRSGESKQRVEKPQA